MKNRVLFLVLISVFGISQAQMKFLAHHKFGQIKFAHLDPDNAQKFYALSIGNHIVSTRDNGGEWDIFYSDPSKKLDLLKFNKNNHELIFTYQNPTTFGMKILTTAQAQITKQFDFSHDGSKEVSIVNYDFVGNDNLNFALHILENSNEGQNNIIIVTTDGGENWTEIYNQTNTNWGSPTQLQFDKNDTQKIYISFANEFKQGIVSTTNFGESFETILEDNGVKYFAINPYQTEEIYAIIDQEDYSKLYHTINLGSDWQELNLNWNSPSFIQYIHFTQDDAQSVIILEENEIATLNNGNFEIQDYASITNENRVLNPSFIDTNGSKWLVQSDFYTLKTENAGTNFTRLKLPFVRLEGSLTYNDFNLNNNVAYMVRNGVVFYNDYEEASYSEHYIGNFDQQTTHPLQFHISDFEGSNKYYLKRESDGNYDLYWASNWFTMNFMNTNFDEYTAIYAIPWPGRNSFHGLYNSQTGKSQLVRINYTVMDNPEAIPFVLPIDDKKITSILVEETMENMLVSFDNVVYRSHDSGQTWHLAMENLPNLEEGDYFSHFAMNYHNPSEIYLASSIGVFKTYDWGQNWTMISEYPADKIFFGYAENKVVAIKHSTPESPMLISYSSNNGHVWRIYDGLDAYHLQTPNSRHSSGVIIRDYGVKLAVGTIDLGVVWVEFQMEEDLSTNNPEINPSTVIIYPNPATDQVSVSTKENVKSIEVYDLSGRKLAVSTTKTINISTLSKGVYTMKILLENGEIHNKKLIRK